MQLMFHARHRLRIASLSALFSAASFGFATVTVRLASRPRVSPAKFEDGGAEGPMASAGGDGLPKPPSQAGERPCTDHDGRQPQCGTECRDAESAAPSPRC